MNQNNSSMAHKSKGIKNLTNRLALVVQKLPLTTMITSIWMPGERAISDDVKKLEKEALDAINKLSLLASSGKQDALIALRDIGNLAAKELEFALVASPPINTRRKKPTKLGPFPKQSVYLRPVIEIQGDFSAILQIINHDETVRTLSYSAILDHIAADKIADRGRFYVNALRSLGFPPEFLHERMAKVSSLSGDQNHPVSILKESLAQIENDAQIPQEQKELRKTQSALFSLIHYLLEARLEELALDNAMDLAKGSLDWPMHVTAYSSVVNEKFQALCLGHSLPFAAASLNQKKGKPPVIKTGSPQQFALEYCVELEKVRRSHLDAGEEQKSSWQKDILGIEKGIADKVIADPRAYSSDKYLRMNGDMWLSILWTEKAALLPEFPSSVIISDQDEAIDKWVDACMARAKMMCSNDWENYTQWPKCVLKRRNQTTKRSRSTPDAVREKLKEGINNLAGKKKSQA